MAYFSYNHHAHILGSRSVFDKLKRLCICDGRGSIRSQDFSGRYRPNYWTLSCGLPPMVIGDEQIEVRLYHVECDEAGALPCGK
ncbi:hypothetical protein CORC01_10524 [Colletotrichum orchidophilum]|uniref:Uncharacterized protein n=1 Tax=Colletotrichum orchidophilum TaxID=1209926 RepID=A0A1G4AYJ0_9PEZI|nr:uncharacterized protein CORC01_10524 [Colletotrichum orchidophilum]OHE94186.1 hypothetical protein CORC01_10524 [Colletotrichum orchidophilum]